MWPPKARRTPDKQFDWHVSWPAAPSLFDSSGRRGEAPGEECGQEFPTGAFLALFLPAGILLCSSGNGFFRPLAVLHAVTVKRSSGSGWAIEKMSHGSTLRCKPTARGPRISISRMNTILATDRLLRVKSGLAQSVPSCRPFPEAAGASHQKELCVLAPPQSSPACIQLPAVLLQPPTDFMRLRVIRQVCRQVSVRQRAVYLFERRIASNDRDLAGLGSAQEVQHPHGRETVGGKMPLGLELAQSAARS
jgi:hypothetical protein